jgi:hypothetical protein
VPTARRPFVLYLALGLAGPVLNLYLGGRWIAATLGLACLHALARATGRPGGLLDLVPSPLPFWIAAAALAWLVFEGPFTP